MIPTNLDMFLGEFLGTMVLIILGNGVGANNTFKNAVGSKGGFFMVGFGWGIAVLAGVCISGIWHAGGYLNPAVTVSSMVNANGLGAMKGIIAIASQLMGAIVGQILLNFVNWKYLLETDGNLVRGHHCTGPTNPKAHLQNFSIEFLGTAILCAFAIFALGTNTERGAVSVPILNALMVALVVTGIIISLGTSTGAAINPARDLGPRLVYYVMYKTTKVKSQPHDAMWWYAWVPIVAPLLAGVVIGAFGRI